LEIPFTSERLATIAQRVLNVDEELKTSQVHRVLTTEENILKAQHVYYRSFECVSTKMLRVSVNSFLEYLTMVVKTMDEFQ
ncbi:transcription factor Pcc1, partial [Backusella circina FSU 941]